jgi:hypothetical protein
MAPKRKRADAAAPPPTNKRAGGRAPPPPRSGALTPPPPGSPPELTLTLLLDLMMLRGVLDAFDLTIFGQCSRELRVAVAGAWKGVRAGNPATRLWSVERRVHDAKKNNTGFREYVPVSQAGDCVVCGKVTRFRHPIEGSMLCAPCGKNAETSRLESLLYRFRLMPDHLAERWFTLSEGFDLGYHLPFAKWKGWSDEPNSTTGWFHHYAPEFAASVTCARKKHEDGIALPSANFLCGARSVFLKRDVICFLLEKYGGPELLQERIRNLALPLLNPAKPDE